MNCIINTTPVGLRQVLASLLALGLLVYMPGCGSKKADLQTQINARLAAFQKAGYPTNLAELNRWYEAVPAEEDAAVIYTEAFAQPVVPASHLPIVGKAKLPSPPEALSGAMRSAIAEYLAKNKKALELLHQGAARKRARYPIDLEKGGETTLPHLAKVKLGVQMLCLESLLNQQTGKLDEAINGLIDGFRLANSLAQEPLIISQLVRLAGVSYGMKSLESLLSYQPLKGPQLTRLALALQENENASGLARSLVGENCMGLYYFTAPLSEQVKAFTALGGEGADATKLESALKQHHAKGLLEADFLLYLEYMQTCMDASQQPLSERLQKLEAIDTLIERAGKQKFFMSLQFMPAVKNAFLKDMRAIALVRAAERALAIENYRLSHSGKLPASLDALKPQFLKEVPDDPFTAQPLRFKTGVLSGYIVYSVGDDRQDDGGAEKPPDAESSQGFDVTITVAR